MKPEEFLGKDPYAGRTLVILNPKAGQDDPARLRRMIGGAFAARCAPFDLVETCGAGHAIELARTGARLGYRAVCVVGGDGTLAEAATGLAGTNVPLGLIPRGTANQVAQNLQIPTEFEAAVDTVVNGTPTPLDLGRIGGRAFALVAGAGYDAAVMAAATRSMKERWGFAAYIFAAVKEALTATPADFRIVADGEEIRVRAVTVMLANMGELYAHFLPFSLALGPQPTRSWQDGLFDVVILAPRNLTEFPAILWRAATRRFSGDDRLIHFQAREVSIEADPPVAVQIDGDEAGQTPVVATAVRGGALILTPT
ncbi:MAG: diacylglycerol kinase family lipid kinase [Gemmatimonadota bacterium]